MDGDTQTIEYSDQDAISLDEMSSEYKIKILVEENKILKRNLFEAQNEIKKYKIVPHIMAKVVDVVDSDKAIILLNTGKFYVNISEELVGKIKRDDEVFIEQKSLTVIGKRGKSKHFDVERYIIFEKPKVSWSEIGGLDEEKRDLKEVIELPLLRPDLFRKIGITPPKGVLLHGPPGCGKTLLAKAVAHQTNANFVEIVGSELVQKYIGEGTKFVKSIFQMAREKAPCIIFIDEIDSIASKRIELGTSGEREVQRTFMQMLAEIDGFKPLGDVKIIGATNRIDILDNAVIRPGRLDRLIKIDYPHKKERLHILKIHTKKMKLEDNVSLESLAVRTKKLSGAQIKTLLVEAGYFALREERFKLNNNDLNRALSKIKGHDKKKQLGFYA
ncbi:MAG: proteasome-activating nucleotidase [Candidatus Nanohalarchaeota archaeon]|nr:MAG: proteasome-activating nucleotidase [Candidatus Nanohaloarchaeota archaeon]